ncbi:hypothetical protein Desor_0682 [Desulfosporosinus orientis DSM 765]|uniref:Uncharacterized protein n=1 Tax=Desulfosporosinus orientis (strain ATCC 19365 / DSM 765 / NCIMB 8382 / VKM B-1628 / Singapore I) TaxID=768706 RepID=G7W5E4_DESOD|nr:hypothetical protein [Desulfosporosinus orientis]AET66372.1 hypothetical protein Desor_0682 [Desulfosporosinus orientis DSM 765]
MRHKAFNSLVKNGKLTGKEVGLMAIKDQVQIYDNYFKDGNLDNGLINQTQVDAMVAGLKRNNDLKDYNDIIELHDYLDRASIAFSLCKQGTKIAVLELTHLLSVMQMAENENIRLHQEPKSTMAEWCEKYMAEAIIKDQGDRITHLIEEINNSIQRCLIYIETVNLFADYIGLPEINNILGEVNIEDIARVNSLMEIIPKYCIKRYGNTANERPEMVLRADLKELLKPINIEALRPTMEATEKAADTLSFRIFGVQNGTEDFYKILRTTAN